MGSTMTLARNVTVNGTNASLRGDATFAARTMPMTINCTPIPKHGYPCKYHAS